MSVSTKPLSWVESSDEEYLPTAQAAPASPVASTKRLRVLLIDDDRSWLATAEGYLQSAYEVTTETDADRALERMGKLRPHLVLLDLHMPRLDGRAVLERIKAEVPHLPVIIVSACEETEVAIACMRSGAKDYLIKPVRGDELRERVERALAERRDGTLCMLYRRLNRLPALRQAADALVDEALRRAGGKQSDAARLLGITQQAVSHRVRRR